MKRIKIRTINILAVLVFCCMSQSCTSGELIIEEKSEFYQSHGYIRKIVSIDPEFLLLDQRRKVEDFVMDTEDREAEFKDYLVENAEKNGIDLQVFSPNTLKAEQIEYYNSLLPLKKQVLFALSTQQTKIEKRKNKGDSFKIKPTRNFFDNNLEIDLTYGNLAEDFGTPYFSLNGVISIKKRKRSKWIWVVLLPPVGINSLLRNSAETLYYHVVVDVSKSEIVYAELRTFHDALSSVGLKSMIFDSYSLLNKK